MGKSNRKEPTNKGRKRKGRDFDQIEEDRRPHNLEKLINQPVDEDLPGLGQFYCVECARHFIDRTSLDAHRKSKVHKKRLKELQQEVFTQKEADAAGGLGSYAELPSPPKRLKKSKIFESGIVLDSRVETD